MKLFLAAALTATFMSAGVDAASVCGTDQMMTMRVSRLSAGGTPAGFLDAVKDHKAWYVSHAMKDDSFVTAPVLVARKGGLAASANEYVTFHSYGTTQPKHDAAWDAYVAKYKANATIVSETRFCVLKGTRIAAR